MSASLGALQDLLAWRARTLGSILSDVSPGSSHRNSKRKLFTWPRLINTQEITLFGHTQRHAQTAHSAHSVPLNNSSCLGSSQQFFSCVRKRQNGIRTNVAMAQVASRYFSATETETKTNINLWSLGVHCLLPSFSTLLWLMAAQNSRLNAFLLLLLRSACNHVSAASSSRNEFLPQRFPSLIRRRLFPSCFCVVLTSAGHPRSTRSRACMRGDDTNEDRHPNA